VVIAGAGLAGTLLAILLGRRGKEVELLERRPDPRRPGDVPDGAGGRSINLALSARGLFALEQVGLRDAVLAQAIPLYGRQIHPVRGASAFQPYGSRGQAINSFSRAELGALLLDTAAATGSVALRFGRRVTGLAEGVEGARSTDPEGGHPETHPGLVVGADGAYSAVRGELVRREGQDFSQAWLGHGYKELTIPPAPDGSHRLEPNALHIWPRGGYMMMAMANRDGSFTVTLYLAFEGPDSFAALADPAAVRAFFARTFPDALELIPGLDSAWTARPTGSLVTVRTRPWHLGGRAVLLGDAAHAIVPFFGQGANAAFEDCLALDAALARLPADPERAFREYEAARRPHTEAIADLALANFVEMRDRVASPWFRLEKRAEVLLGRLAPGRFLPLYTMISFTRIPYADARARAARQLRLLRGILAGTVLLLLTALWLLLR
jgi:kynurenine 3-monooxygenase